MTHFTVLVKYEGDIGVADAKIAEMLAPYDENKEGPRRKEYMSKGSVESALKHFGKGGTMSPSGVVLPSAQLTPEEIEEWEGHKGGGKDKKGYFYYTTYNELSEWDWYQVGGRWQGMLLLKPNAKGLFHKRSYSLKEGMKDEKGVSDKGVDIAYLKDVDFERMRSEATASATEEYYKAMDFVLKSLDEGKKFNDLVAELYFNYGVEDESLEELLARRGSFMTHAVLDDKGWHEASKMGWWGAKHNQTEDDATWLAKFAERFLSNPTDKTVIAVVDCHI